MRFVAAFALAALAACSSAAEPEGQEGAVGAAAAEEIVSRHSAGENGPFAPRDECGALEGAREFRLELVRAVLARDADALVALAAPDIALDYGGGAGREELLRRLSDPEWGLWASLEALLPLGCATDEQGYLTLPWYFAQDPGTPDAFGTMVTLGEDVPLLGAARADADVLATLPWAVVVLDPEGFNGDLTAYARVQTLDGATGWIAEEKLRSWVDYRLIAEKGDQGWRLVAFIAGD